MTGLGALVGPAAWSLLGLLLRASLEGAVVIAAVALLVRALPNLPAALRCTLWWLACAKLVVGLGVAAVGVEVPWLPSAAARLPGFSAAATTVSPAAERDGAATVPGDRSGGPLATPAARGPATPRSPADPDRTYDPLVAPTHRTAGVIAATEPAAAAAGQAGTPAKISGRDPAAGVPADAATASAVSAGAAGSLAAALVLLWLLGVGVGILRWTRQRLRLGRLLAGATPVDDPAVHHRLSDLAGRIGVPAPRLLGTADADTPQVVGTRRPSLLLPAAALRPGARRDLNLILAHELAHLRRRDLLLGWLPAVVQTLFFFHPPAVFAVREYALAREAACDAESLRLLGAAPRDYGRMLLHWGTAPQRGPLAATLGHRRQLKRRLLMLENHPAAHPERRRPWAPVLAVTLLAVAALLPLRLVAATPDPPPAPVAPPAEAAPPAPAPVPAPQVASPATVAPTPQEPAPAAPTPEAAPAAPAEPHAPEIGHSAALAAAPGLPNAPTLPAAPALAPQPELPTAPSLPPAAAFRLAEAAPAPPTAVAPATGGSRSSYSYRIGDDGEAMVFLEGDQRVSFHGSSTDMERASELRRGDEALLWFVRDGREYVIRDPATLERVRRAYAPALDLAERQAELGARQGELGAQQGELGAEQGALGARQAELGAQMARLGAELAGLVSRRVALEMDDADHSGELTELEVEQEEVEAKMEALGERMESLGAEQEGWGEQQAELGARQRALGEEQRALGEKQRAAMANAEEEVDGILRRAIESGTARPVDR